jgi:hypothetical protein
MAKITLYPPATLDRQEVNHEIATILDFLCREIELPPARADDAKSRYESIGKVLTGDDSSLRVFYPRVYAQGSMSLGTTTRPLKTHEFDVDLACSFNYLISILRIPPEVILAPNQNCYAPTFTSSS